MGSNQIQRLVDLELITQLQARYHLYKVTQDRTAPPSLFLDDTVYDGGSQVLEGLDRVVETFNSGLAGGQTAHIARLPEVGITSPGTAKGDWAFRDYIDRASDKEPDGFFAYGQEQDRYVRTAAGWKIAKITITGIRIDPPAGSLPNAFERKAA